MLTNGMGLLSLAKILPRGVFSRKDLPLADFRKGIEAGKQFVEFLTFFTELASSESSLAWILGDEKTLRSTSSARMLIEEMQDQIAALLPTLCNLQVLIRKLLPTLFKHYHKRWGRSGNSSNLFEDTFIVLADQIWQKAGGKGVPTHRRPKTGKKWTHWEGGSLDFVIELMSQAGYGFQSRDAIAQRIYKLSKFSSQKIA